jgi:hypothetical protein
MPKQPELIRPQPLTVTPAMALAGPRLWVRRLVIWKEPGGEKVRDVQLAPGLKKRLQDLRREQTQLIQQTALAKRKLDPLANRVSAIEKARDSRGAAWYSARRLRDDIEQLSDRISAQDSAAKTPREMATKIEAERLRLTAFRDEQARVLGRLSQKFDSIVRRLLGQEAKGRIVLSGAGIELSIDLGGDRATAAIDSLKALAFDLAALCLCIEGATRVPAFLVHDSPREADLGLSIYHELFRMVRELERSAEQPLFQYIVTTTTEPPDTFKTAPRLRLVIRGAPAEERLLTRNL